jgi:hypothetical protein
MTARRLTPVPPTARTAAERAEDRWAFDVTNDGLMLAALEACDPTPPDLARSLYLATKRDAERRAEATPLFDAVAAELHRRARLTKLRRAVVGWAAVVLVGAAFWLGVWELAR